MTVGVVNIQEEVKTDRVAGPIYLEEKKYQGWGGRGVSLGEWLRGSRHKLHPVLTEEALGMDTGIRQRGKPSACLCIDNQKASVLDTEFSRRCTHCI